MQQLKTWCTLLVGLWLVPGLAYGQPQLTDAWEITGPFEKPESVVFDSVRNALYLSNISGGGSEKDGNGFISKISPDGEVMEAQWVTGLDAPKGLAMSNGRLYAADIDELVEIDPETGEITARYPAENAEFLNDVTADAYGHVYVSDSRNSTIYRLSDGQLEGWMQDEQIQAPNGLLAKDGRLLVAAGGPGAENPGGQRYLQAIALDSSMEVTALAKEEPRGSLDGIKPDGQGGYFLTDWSGGQLMHVDPSADGGMTLLKSYGEGKGAADLEYIADRNLLVVPVMMDHKLVAYRVE